MYSMIGILFFLDLDVKAIDKMSHRILYDRLKDENRQVLELDCGENADKLRGEYLDMCEVVHS